MATEKKYWFPAKTYGWGWGAPVTWQGWVTVVVCLGLLLGVGFLFPFATAPYAYGAGVVIVDAVFFGICWRTGEPPSWRWGNK